MVEDDGDVQMPATEGPTTPWWIPSQRASMVALVLTVLLILLAATWEYFTTLAILSCITWLVAAIGLPRTGLYDRLLGLGRRRLVLALLVLALAVRWILLLQSNPADTLAGAGEVAMRGERLLSGEIPYQDFPVRKPPMYLYMGGGIVSLMGTSVEGVRFVLGFLDALVAIVLLYIGSSRYSDRAGIHAGLLYAIFPIGVFSVGIAGHYDGVVVLVTMAGLLFHQRGRYYEGLMLIGLGFAFKLYPAVLLPWLVWRERDWNRRIAGLAVFALPMAISWLPVLIINPDALSQYSNWQSTWLPMKSIAYGIVQMAGWAGDSTQAVAAGQAVTWAFLLLLVAMFVDWVRRRTRDIDGHMRDWFRVAMVGFAGYYIMVVTGTIIDYRLAAPGLSPVATGWLVFVLFTIVAVYGLHNLFFRFLEPWPSLAQRERLYMSMTLSVLLLLLSSAQGNAWYLVWLFSLVLLIQEERVRTVLMAISIWNVEDAGITLWPGVRYRGNSPL
jgi:hypothetical protein